MSASKDQTCKSLPALTTNFPNAIFLLYLSYLHTSLQHLMQNMGPSFHNLNISLSGICMLSIGDRVDKAVSKLPSCTK